jgi:uncharacterized membrane protein
LLTSSRFNSQVLKQDRRKGAPVQKTTLIENGSLALSIVFTGIMAGFFNTYTFNVNLAMAQVDGSVYAQMQSLFNINVRHWVFFVFFFGASLVSLLALLLNWRQRHGASFWLLGVVCVLYTTGIVVFTQRVNLPLNAYTESWTIQAPPTDWMLTRDAWNNANAIRSLVSFVAFVLGLLALVLRIPNSSAAIRAVGQEDNR